MLTDPAYAYIVGTILLGAVWLPFFFYRKDLRREMVMIGVLIGIIAPLWAPWFFTDYWSPMYAFWFGIEDFLYGFFAGGIISVIYEEVYAKRLSRRKISHNRSVLHLTLIGGSSALVFNVGIASGVNSIYAAITSFIVFFSGIAWYRRDLIPDALVSGALFTGVTFAFFLVFTALYPDIIEAWWQLDNLSGYMVVGIPLEELLWAFSMGMAGGPLYEFVSGKRLVYRKAQ